MSVKVWKASAEPDPQVKSAGGALQNQRHLHCKTGEVSDALRDRLDQILYHAVAKTVAPCQPTNYYPRQRE